MTKKKTSKSKTKKKSNPISRKLTNGASQITKFLDQARVKYNLIEHRVVYTAHDAAQTTKKKLSEIAKVVLVKVDGAKLHAIASPHALEQHNNLKQKIASSDALLAMTKGWALIVLPAGKYLDLSGIKKTLKAKKISIATEKDIIKILKTKIGLLHPFGNLYKLQTLVDKGILKGKKLLASAGSYTHSIEMNLKDFERLTLPIKGFFSKNKR